MQGRKLIATGFLAAAALASASVLAQPGNDARDGGHGNAGNGRCQLHSDNNRIQHVVYIHSITCTFDGTCKIFPATSNRCRTCGTFWSITAQC